ncbi:hypothetical protein [Lactiplantibacillus pentosus]|uniref:hypothetical protein n=1 Tax=Lactiplantibacillus pentosus TaxID=1589 RepID=UPI003D2F4106
MDTALVEFIKTLFIEEYRWDGDSLYIWVADYNWSSFKTIFKKLVGFEDGGIPARIQDDCIFIDLSKTEFLGDYFEELKVGFPEV